MGSQFWGIHLAVVFELVAFLHALSSDVKESLTKLLILRHVSL